MVFCPCFLTWPTMKSWHWGYQAITCIILKTAVERPVCQLYPATNHCSYRIQRNLTASLVFDPWWGSRLVEGQHSPVSLLSWGPLIARWDPQELAFWFHGWAGSLLLLTSRWVFLSCLAAFLLPKKIFGCLYLEWRLFSSLFHTHCINRTINTQEECCEI